MSAAGTSAVDEDSDFGRRLAAGQVEAAEKVAAVEVRLDEEIMAEIRALRAENAELSSRMDSKVPAPTASAEDSDLDRRPAAAGQLEAVEKIAARGARLDEDADAIVRMIHDPEMRALRAENAELSSRMDSRVPALAGTCTQPLSAGTAGGGEGTAAAAATGRAGVDTRRSSSAAPTAPAAPDTAAATTGI